MVTPTYKGMEYVEIDDRLLPDGDAMDELAKDLGIPKIHGECSLCPIPLAGDLQSSGYCPADIRICDRRYNFSHCIRADMLDLLRFRGVKINIPNS